MHCELLPIASFERIAEDWDRLAQRYRQAPFLHVDFVQPLIECFSGGDERIVRLVDGCGLVAIGVFCRRGGMWETFQPSQIPIGCLVVREGVEWAALLGAIGRAMPGLAIGVAATQQDPLFNLRPRDDGGVKTLDYIVTAAIEVAGSFDDYWNARGKNLRQNLRKQRRKLADEGLATTLEIASAPDEMRQGVADYGRLESAGWKAQGGTAVAADNPQGRFYCSMLERFAARGRGKILRYRIGGRIAVVDLCIESDDALVVLKTTYDEALGNYSPAALMREEFLRQVWEAGRIRRIEFYGRMMEWHTRWTDQWRTMYHVNWHRWPALTSLAARLRQQLRPAAGAPVQPRLAEMPGSPNQSC